MRRFFRNNGLSVVLFALFFVFWVGQFLVGHTEYNHDQQDHGQPTIDSVEYLRSSHFLEATMENWESEFLQMFAYVIFTVFLYQKGSAESKKPGESEPVDRKRPKNKRTAPWPVRQGGVVAKLYGHSLSLAFALLFLLSFVLHAAGGAREYNQDQLEHGRAERVTTLGYMTTSRLWFESLQNWQSEFLAVGAMVVLSIFLRERGSAESKPVDAPHWQTGDE